MKPDPRKRQEIRWTSIFTESMMELVRTNPKLVAITAAMPGPTGLRDFGKKFPKRMFDVGIAEQHAVTSAAGMAMGGLHPVVAIYSTFMNRALDQVMMDVALHHLPVTFVLDRAGITGNDGASHNGMWDLSILNIVPGMRVAAPRDAIRLREELAEALAIESGPTALRFPKGTVTHEVPELERRGGVDILVVPAEGRGTDILLIAVGACASLAVLSAQSLSAADVGVTVVDPRWVFPVCDAVVELAAQHRLVVTLEDNGKHGGVGSAVSGALRAGGIDVPCRDLGIPQRFIGHASRDEVLEMFGLTEQQVARTVIDWWAAVVNGRVDVVQDLGCVSAASPAVSSRWQ
jgi:1-deoxy-D-xylulose-5-phosphate synthase